MEKTKITILKSPTILAIITFLLAFAITVILKVYLGFESTSIEFTIFLTAISLASIYGFYIKEKMSKIYRLKYSLIITFINSILNILVIYSQQKTGESNFVLNMSYMFFAITCILMPIFIYKLTGTLSKQSAEIDYEKMIIMEKTLPKKTRAKRKTISILFFGIPMLFIAGCILAAENTRDLNPKIILLMFLSIIIITKFGKKYLKPIKDVDQNNVD